MTHHRQSTDHRILISGCIAAIDLGTRRYPGPRGTLQYLDYLPSHFTTRTRTLRTGTQVRVLLIVLVLIRDVETEPDGTFSPERD